MRKSVKKNAKSESASFVKKISSAKKMSTRGVKMSARSVGKTISTAKKVSARNARKLWLYFFKKICCESLVFFS